MHFLIHAGSHNDYGKIKNEDHEKVEKRRNEKCNRWYSSRLWLVSV